MVGRKAAVSADMILKKLLNYEIFTKEKKLKKKSDKIWCEISSSLNNLVKPITLYFHVSQNQHNVLVYYKKYKGLEEPIDDFVQKEKNENDVIDEESNDSSVDFSPEKGRRNARNRELLFDLKLPIDEWNSIKPVKKVYKDKREGVALQEGWTDVMRKYIWEFQKLPCAFSFDRHCVDANGSYIKIKGHCTTCTSKISIKCNSEPTLDQSQVIFTVKTKDSRKIPHIKKNRLQKSERAKVKEELKHKTPKQWRREKASKLMNVGDCEPPTLYNLPSLQKARQAVKNEELGIEPGIELFNSLSNISNDVEFNKYIREIGYLKFFISYWSPEQVSLNNDIRKALNNPVSLDATGSIALNIKRPNGESSAIFLSVLSTFIGNMIVPLTQAFSEKNDTIFYYNWLSRWILSGAKIPKELVTDMGRAIQNGACMAFNCIHFKTYNNLCILILLKKKIFIELQTQLRIDIAHLIHAVTKWPCFNDVATKVKLFFTKCLGFMSTIDNLDQFTKILRSVLIVAHTKTLNKTTNEVINYLLGKIKSFNISFNVSKEKVVCEKEEEKKVDVQKDDEEEEHDYIVKFLNDIKDSVISDINEENNSDLGSQSNDYYLPDFGKRLIELCHQFPCWSNVMNDYFNNVRDVATSARSEALFGEFKKSIENTILRVDKVLIIHCRQIDADIKLARAALNNWKKTCKSEIEVKTTDCNFDHLKAAERWKNKYSFTDCENEKEESVELSEIDNVINTPMKEYLKEKSDVQTVENEDSFSEWKSEESIKLLKNDSIASIIELEKSPKILIKPEIEENEDVMIHDNSLIDHDYTNFKEAVELNSTPTDNNKIEIKRERGYYVSADPEIVLHLQKPKTPVRNKGILQNGNKQQPRSVHGKKIYFTNTCAFDSITEILSNAVRNVQNFKDFVEVNIDDTKSVLYQCFPHMLIKYAISGVNNIIYTYRAHILFSLFSLATNSTSIDCDTNVGALFKNLMATFDCPREVIDCSNCEFHEEFRRPSILLPDVKIVWIHNYRNLEDEMKKYFKDEIKKCKNCNKNANLKKSVGPYLWIDTDEAYRSSTYAESIGIDSKSLMTPLADIPTELKINNDNYVLCGVVKYVPPVVKLGHYVAMCRSINNNWSEKNDLNKHSKTISSKTSIKVNGLFYVKYNNKLQ